MNPTKMIVDQTVAALRLLYIETRENAAVVLAIYGPLVRMREESAEAAAEVEHLVLDHFLPAEPPTRPYVHWLPAVQADAATLVAETVAALDEPKARRWQDRCGDFWQERPDGLIALVTEDGLSALFVYGDVADLEHEFGPLVEVAQ